MKESVPDIRYEYVNTVITPRIARGIGRWEEGDIRSWRGWGQRWRGGRGLGWLLR
jgi:hypothetical protein